ncbi:MAG: pentapeptide repeat-containing protein [Pseudomonadota bacterium]
MSDHTLEQIKEIAQQARTTWFTLLGFLTFAGAALLGVTPADFYAFGRNTQLPLVGVEIPTTSFFAAAPVLITALYVYFQLQLVSLFARVGDLVPDAYGVRLDRAAHPGLITAYALRQRRDHAVGDDTSLGHLAHLVVFLLVWAFAPVVLAWFWWQSMIARDEWLTLFLGGLLLFAAWVGIRSWDRARALGQENAPPSRRRRRAFAVVLVALVAVLSWTRTEGGLDHYADWTIQRWNANVPDDWRWLADTDDRRQWISRAWLPEALFQADVSRLSPLRFVALAPVDLRGVELVERPDTWRDHDAALRTFQDAWCARKGYEQPCDLTVDDRADTFERDWDVERDAAIANLQKLEKPGVDLREADLSQAYLAGVDLSAARLQGADLRGARLEGADLRGARLEGAKLRGARLEGANLRHARMEAAYLAWAQLERADLGNAELVQANLNAAHLAGANLMGARLDRANLWGVVLERADLRGARLTMASLREARLVGANLSGAQLDGTDLRQARLEGANLRRAQLEGADLRQAWLEDAVLREARLEGANFREARLAGADMSDAWLVGADFWLAHLEDVDLHRARLDGANLYQAQLVGADLREARLDGANLWQVRLDGADLRQVWLEEADLREARLQEANLWLARLEGADLRDAQLEGTDLRKARLAGADVSTARLAGAALMDADFSRTDLTQSQLEGTIGSVDTILPRDRDTGQQLFVRSCWRDAPPSLDATLAPWPPAWQAAFYRAWLCDRRPPGFVGTPAE